MGQLPSCILRCPGLNENVLSFQKFFANKDRYEVVSHDLDPSIIARFVRFEPQTFHGHVSMRAELYGCTSGEALVGFDFCNFFPTFTFLTFTLSRSVSHSRFTAIPQSVLLSEALLLFARDIASVLERFDWVPKELSATQTLLTQVGKYRILMLQTAVIILLVWSRLHHLFFFRVPINFRPFNPRKEPTITLLTVTVSRTEHT